MPRLPAAAVCALFVMCACTDGSTGSTAIPAGLDDEQRCLMEARALGLDIDSMTASEIDDTPSPSDRKFGCTVRLTDGRFVDIHVPADGEATFNSVLTGLPAPTTACEHIFEALMLTTRGVSGDPVKKVLEAALAAPDLTAEQRDAVQRSLDQFTVDRTSPSFDPFGAYYDTIDVYRSTCPNGTPIP